MKRLSFLLLLLCIFISGCNTANLNTKESTIMRGTAVPATQVTETDIASAEPIVPSSFTVCFIDVGKADSAIVLCDGKSMLIDGGNTSDSDTINAFLKKLNITFLDYIIATHAHKDHIGGLPDVLNTVIVGKVYAPQTSEDSKEYKNFIESVKKQNLTITTPVAGDIINLGSSTITFLAPIKETYNDVNNTSIVMRIIYGNTFFLFTGDAGCQAEADIIAAGYTLESTVIKIGHHGADTSTSNAFLGKVKPGYAVISCGKDNLYPSETLLNRLHDTGVKIYRTDTQGDITATSNGTDVTFSTQKN